MKGKRGITPLIATVILVGFTIVLAGFAWYFLSGQVKDAIDKEGAKCSAQEAAQIEFSVPSCATAPGTPERPGPAKAMTIKNSGKIVITGFRVRVGEGDTGIINPDISPGEERQIAIDGTGTEVTLFPVLVQEGKVITCSEKLVTVDC
ncbi:MAG: archaellin/type IV pilin N-terminal domain-containing protein [Candidatus Nanoarchaeia archaeon]